MSKLIGIVVLIAIAAIILLNYVGSCTMAWLH